MLAFMVNSALALVNSCYGTPCREHAGHIADALQMPECSGTTAADPGVCLASELNPVSSECAAGSDLKLYTFRWDYTRARLTPCARGLRWARGSTVPLLVPHPRCLQLVPPPLCYFANDSEVQCCARVL